MSKPKSLGVNIPANLLSAANRAAGRGVKPKKSKGKRRGEMNRLEAELHRLLVAAGVDYLRYEEETIVAIRTVTESGQQDTKYTPDFICEILESPIVLEVKGRRITKDIHRFNAASERWPERAFYLAEKGRNGWTLTPRGRTACDIADMVRGRILRGA